MPRISEFYGIIITMNYDDHNPPHFHARYAGRSASYRIAPLGIMAGGLPPRARAMVEEWALVHQEDLLENWECARRHEPLKSIPGLD